MLAVAIKGITYAINILVAAGIVKEVIQWFRGTKEADKALAATAEETGNSLDDVLEVRAGVLYERIENEGGNPDDFWAGLSAEDRERIKFSPEAVRRSMDRTSFLGMASALAWIGAAAAALFAGARGLPIASKYLKQVLAAKNSGEAASVISNILQTARLESIQKLGIPGIIAGILGAAGWQIGGWANNLNDVDFWGRVNLQQAEEDFLKMQAKLAQGGGTGSGSSYTPASYTRVETRKVAKPKLFTGTFFSGRLGHFDEFVRQVDDRIESFEDMLDDIEINLKRWYEKLPGMLSYELVVVNQPKDELGMTKTGIWVVMNLYITNSWHKRMLLENILLGPVDPAVYYPDDQAIYSINLSVPKILSPEDIENLDLPSGREYTVDKNGNVVAGPFGGYGTKLGLGDTSKTAEAIKEATENISKAVEETKAGQQSNQQTPAKPSKTFSALNGTFDLYTPDGVDTYLYAISRGYTQRIDGFYPTIPLYGVNYDITDPTQLATFKAALAAGPSGANTSIGSSQQESSPQQPVSKGPNLVQTFPRSVIVKADVLNVRSQPNTSAPLAGSQKLYKGDQFTATNLVVGESVEGNNLWWLSSKGNYVWSGGTR